MAGSPIFSVNFTNRKNSAVLNYHKSWSWSNQPVLWDFYIMFLLVTSLWMFVTVFCPKHGVTGDVWRYTILTFHTAFAENLHALVGFATSGAKNTLQHYLVDDFVQPRIAWRYKINMLLIVPGGRGGENFHMKGAGLLIVSLRGVNFGFWF